MLKKKIRPVILFAIPSSGVAENAAQEIRGRRIVNNPQKGKRQGRRDSACRGILVGKEASGVFSKNSPQKRHLVASVLISSAQNGHFFVSFDIINFLFLPDDNELLLFISCFDCDNNTPKPVESNNHFAAWPFFPSFAVTTPYSNSMAASASFKNCFGLFCDVRNRTI